MQTMLERAREAPIVCRNASPKRRQNNRNQNNNRKDEKENRTNQSHGSCLTSPTRLSLTASLEERLRAQPTKEMIIIKITTNRFKQNEINRTGGKNISDSEENKSGEFLVARSSSDCPTKQPTCAKLRLPTTTTRIIHFCQKK